MKKLTLQKANDITFREGCEKYLDDCRVRNLREGTIGHYRQSYVQFYKYFDPDMPVSEFSEKHYNDYIMYLKEVVGNDQSINSYLRDLITTVHFWINQAWVKPFRMRTIKFDRHQVETYSDSELRKLLKKPDMKKCSFTEYQCWVITSFLFSTGIRQRSLHFIKIKDIDFDNEIVHINVTKNRKPLIVPLSQSMVRILREYLKLRPYESAEEYLFVNVFGRQLCKGTSYHMLYWYNKGRGVEKTGIHRYRHTFAKQWILNGGNVVTLSKLLGHSSLDITQDYIHLLVTDLGKEVKAMNLLDKFAPREAIKLKRDEME